MSVMGYNIRKAGVIGAGTMGSGIAALLAGVGIEVVLLDVPARDTIPETPPAERNAPALEGLKRMQNARPPQLFALSDLDLIRTGNIEDDLSLLHDAGWVIEVVVERLDVKQQLMGRLAEVVGPETIISTNTSGLPIRAIADGLGERFSRRFLGTHFFNPPRYLRLLEIIPHPNTDPEILDFMVDFATRTLGKGVVIANDTPNFIGNRFLSIVGSQTVNAALDNGLTVDEVDALTGPLIGRPRTATFRLNDLIGLDVLQHIADNLYPAIADDPARDVLRHPGAQALFRALLDRNWLGNKSGQGFYKQVKTADGRREFWTLNLSTLEYEPPSKPAFESVARHQHVADTGERIRLLIGEDDRAGRFLWHHHAFYLAYASHRVPEITASLANIDNAQKWGFGHELGPFEIWDALGVAATVPAFEDAGYPVAAWVKEMIAAGYATFYQRDETGQAIGYYSPQAKTYVPFAGDERAVSIPRLRSDSGRIILSNDSASLLDMGDGVGLLALHSPNSQLDAGAIDMLWRALDHLDNGLDALVIGAEGDRFCAGSNLFALLTLARAGQLDDLNATIKRQQDALKLLRYAAGPVVVTPFGVAQGAGVELMLSADRVVAHMELAAGFTEPSAGLIPMGGGCNALLRRFLNPVMEASEQADPLPHIRRAFDLIAGGRVSGSATEARQMRLLGECDRIVMNRAHLLGEAKREALHLAGHYRPGRAGKVWAAGRDAYDALLKDIDADVAAEKATEHDALLRRKLAYVLTGGPVDEPGWVDEQTILDLEREVALELLGEVRTLERIAHLLQTGKPLKN